MVIDVKKLYFCWEKMPVYFLPGDCLSLYIYLLFLCNNGMCKVTQPVYIGLRSKIDFMVWLVIFKLHLFAKN